MSRIDFIGQNAVVAKFEIMLASTGSARGLGVRISCLSLSKAEIQKLLESNWATTQNAALITPILF